jgi:hypothetical protein
VVTLSSTPIPPSPRKASPTFSSYASTFTWRDRLADDALWPQDKGWRRDGAELSVIKDFGRCVFSESGPDCAIRLRVRYDSLNSFIDIFARSSSGTEFKPHYVAVTRIMQIPSVTLCLYPGDNVKTHDLLPASKLGVRNSGEEHSLEFYVQGKHVDYYYDGKLAASAQDSTLDKGKVGILCGFPNHLLSVETGTLTVLAADRSSRPASEHTISGLPQNLPPVAPQSSALEEALLGFFWSWEDKKDAGYALTIQFLPNGSVSGGWHWQWLRKPNGEAAVDCFWGPDQHMYLDFNKELTGFVATGGASGPAIGKRLKPKGQPLVASNVAIVSHAPLPQPITPPPPVPMSKPVPSPAPPVVAVAAVAQQPSAPVRRGEQPMIEILSDQAPNVANWITAPLDRDVPGEIWQNMTFLKEALKDEAAKGPTASPAAYGLAVQLCYTLVADLEERRAAETLSGGDVVLHQKSNLTEWRRDHLTWPMYALEADERAERERKAKKTKVFMKDLKIQEWANRSRAMRVVIDAQYSQFREALRQSPPRK